VTLDLLLMPKPKKSKGNCDLDMLPGAKESGTAPSSPPAILTSKPEFINLFEQKRVRGFIPFVGAELDENGQKTLAGKVEVEIEVVTEEEALERPAGKGQDEPNENPHLEAPQRPETSFLWFTSPWKTFKHIVWKRYKWWFIIGVLLILLILFIALFIYYTPEVLLRKIFRVS